MKNFNERIKKHKERRSIVFETHEESIFIDKAIEKVYKNHDIIILECLTTWLGNVFHDYKDDAADFAINTVNNIIKTYSDKSENSFENLLSFTEKNNFKYSIDDIDTSTEKILIFVSNEIGLGIVPENKISRDFRDVIGLINQIVAQSSDFVYVATAGIPKRLK